MVCIVWRRLIIAIIVIYIICCSSICIAAIILNLTSSLGLGDGFSHSEILELVENSIIMTIIILIMSFIFLRKKVERMISNKKRKNVWMILGMHFLILGTLLAVLYVYTRLVSFSLVCIFEFSVLVGLSRLLVSLEQIFYLELFLNITGTKHKGLVITKRQIVFLWM